MTACRNCKRRSVEFYDSNKSWCKDCIRQRAKESRLARLDEVREYDRERGRTRKRKASCKAYAKTDAGKAARARACAAWTKRNPEKRKAQVAVGNAVRDGRLVKKPCEVCGARKVQAHHDDYSKPLEVRWLCVKHHTHHHHHQELTNGTT